MFERGELGVDIIDASTSDEHISLDRLRCREASEMLGIWIAHDGNNIKLNQVLKNHLLNGVQG